MGPLIPLFWTSGDVCPGCQSQSGSLACMLPHLRAKDFSDLELEKKLLFKCKELYKTCQNIYIVSVNVTGFCRVT